jgi:glyoxylase-like metal-dependent hydrolase (beta-lactamase superfamily II)
VLVDPAYDVNALADVVEADGMRVTGVLATHYHADHVGGSMMGYRIQGITTLLERMGVKIHVQSEEAEFVKKVTGVSDNDLTLHGSGDTVMVGNVPIQLLHTPGHTPGSQCFLVDGRLVSGDTLFLDGCGRTDFPGSDPAAMYDSLHRLASLPEDTVLYPGHNYSPPHAHLPMSTVKQANYVYRPTSKEQWLAMFGA